LYGLFQVSVRAAGTVVSQIQEARLLSTYEGVSKSFRTGRLER